MKQKKPVSKPIGILGGTFDPVHYGHLRSALEVLEELQLAQVRFIPSHTPPHRDAPLATPEQRLALVQHAIADQPGLVMDDRELTRRGPSYTRDTLACLRSDLDDTPLCLLLGMDAFVTLPTWHGWRELLQLAHIVVMHRPGSEPTLADELKVLVASHRSDDGYALREQPAGRIVFQPVTQLDISATQIRCLLAQGKSPRYLLPDAVLAYIGEQRLYGFPETFSHSVVR